MVPNCEKGMVVRGHSVARVWHASLTCVGCLWLVIRLKPNDLQPVKRGQLVSHLCQHFPRWVLQIINHISCSETKRILWPNKHRECSSLDFSWECSQWSFSKGFVKPCGDQTTNYNQHFPNLFYLPAKKTRTLIRTMRRWRPFGDTVRSKPVKSWWMISPVGEGEVNVKDDFSSNTDDQKGGNFYIKTTELHFL